MNNNLFMTRQSHVNMDDKSCPCITMWKFVPALTIQHIMPCMNSTQPLEIYMLPGQMEEEAWRDPRAPPIGLKVEEAMTSAEIHA